MSSSIGNQATQLVQEPEDTDFSADLNMDPEMATAMGFTSFGTSSKKRKYLHNDAIVDVAIPDQGKGANSVPVGLRHASKATEGVQAEAQNRELPLGAPAPRASQPKQRAEDASAHHIAGGVFSDQVRPELGAYVKGVSQANGDIAYFLPSFLEDPWAKLVMGK